MRYTLQRVHKMDVAQLIIDHNMLFFSLPRSSGESFATRRWSDAVGIPTLERGNEELLNIMRKYRCACHAGFLFACPRMAFCWVCLMVDRRQKLFILKRWVSVRTNALLPILPRST